ncbi:MAG: iron dependent repressor, metal binding and dimerization domain protein, partial [Candidatus Brocadia sp.]
MTEPSQEEILELIWTIEEESGKVEKDTLIKKIHLPTAEGKLNALVDEDYVTITDNKVKLTKKGRADARLVIRRHRLAERLLNDVLDVKEYAMDSSACK